MLKFHAGRYKYKNKLYINVISKIIFKMTYFKYLARIQEIALYFFLFFIVTSNICFLHTVT